MTTPGFDIVPALPVPGQAAALPPVLDLTVPAPWLPGPATDAADDAAIDLVAGTPGAVALWRAWRIGPGPATRVYLAEVAAAVVLDPPGARVETYATGTEPTAEQRRIRGGAALLWAAAPAVPVRISKVFDRVDPISGPLFDGDHPRLDDPIDVLAYLDGGAVLLATTERMSDVLAPGRGPVVPMSYRTDGRWIWTDTVAYYLREHGLAPDPELLAHITAAGTPGAVSAVDVHRAQAALFAPVDTEAAWTVG